MFRLWESMTFGAVAIIERGVGFDKSVSLESVCTVYVCMYVCKYAVTIVEGEAEPNRR